MTVDVLGPAGKYAESWQKIDESRLALRAAEIEGVLNRFFQPENYGRKVREVVVIGPGIGADARAIRKLFPGVFLRFIDCDPRAQQRLIAELEVGTFSFIQADAATLQDFGFSSDGMCIAMRTSAEIADHILDILLAQPQSLGVFFFSLLVDTESPQVFSRVKSKAESLGGKFPFLFEGRAFTEQAFFITS